MSSHCSNYPACQCPPEMGSYCHTKWDMQAIILKNQNDIKVQEELAAAVEKLSDGDKILYHRGYKTFKRNGMSELVLVDNLPWKSSGGPRFTPPKKKRRKRG